MKKIVAMLVCTFMLCMSYSNISRADFGPKPSVQIDFVNLDDELCYGTLLANVKSTGPSSSYEVSGARHNEIEGCEYLTFDYETWKAFVDYEDSDGFHFLQEGWRVDDSKELNWTYYPPSTFKILLYYPESETFVVSGIYERYAFDSHFTVDMKNLDKGLVAEKSYDYTWEIISLTARVFVTILIELVIAFIFLYKNKKQIRFIMIVNVVTQIILNVALNVVNYHFGFLMFCFAYAVFELNVFAIEAVAYRIALPRWDTKERRKSLPIVYALIANIASYAIGYMLTQWNPGIG